MEYHTPGVYIREVDSGAKPIASVATSIPAFLGLFEFTPPTDAIAIAASDGDRELSGKVVPQLVDAKGSISATKAEEAGTALAQAFNLKRNQVKDLKKLLELNGHKPTIAKGGAGKTKITVDKTSVEVDAEVLDVAGKVITESDAAVEELLNSVHATFGIGM